MRFPLPPRTKNDWGIYWVGVAMGVLAWNIAYPMAKWIVKLIFD
jgi:hypothetical protein